MQPGTDGAAGDPSRILVINVCRIGDTLLATPVLRALAARYPRAAITCLGHPKRVELLRHLPFAGQVGGITKRTAPFRGWLPGRPFDLALVHGFDMALVRYALRVSRRVVAFEQKDPGLNARLEPAVPYPDIHSLHAVDLHLRLSEAAGAPAAGRSLAYRVTDGERAQARAHLRESIRPWSRPLVGFVVESFATKPYRDWPIEHFAGLARELAARHPQARFVLFGGAVAEARRRVLAEAVGERLVSFAGKLGLRESAARIAELDLYVGVDTGPTHLAGALGVPMVALYHGLHPAWQLAPLDHPALACVQQERPLEGDPRLHGMGSIPVERVLRFALELLARSPRRAEDE